MTLYEQLAALAYHLLSAQIFGLFFSFLSLCLLAVKKSMRVILYSLFSMMITIVFYYGLYQINGGVTHVYLIVVFLWSLYLYYHFFYELILPFFYHIKKLFRPLKEKTKFAKRKIYDIMKVQKDKRKEEKLKNEQRKSHKKQKDKKS